MSDIAAIRDVLSQFWRLRIAVAGDLTLCRTLHVTEEGRVTKAEDTVGGIGLVLAALCELTVQIRAAVTVVGDDGVWYELKGRFAELTFSTDYLQSDGRWTTPVDYQIIEAGAARRWRLRHDGVLDEALSLPLQMQLRVACRQHDGLVIVDRSPVNEASVIDNEIRRVARHIAEQDARKRLIVWSDAPLGQFAGWWRYLELEDWSASIVDNDLGAISAAATEHRETYFLRTETGLIVAPPGQAAQLLPARARADLSPDAILATIAAAGIAGADPLTAAQIGVAAATISGTVTSGAIAAVIEKK
ncbi:hypothetical protein M4951_00880 [Blastopirellula sp. J2-11]|uniref:hypothetical protein n=1 Tax=Blastopirellula sp. J2-11 TaxID=2943192 RepID=UPI0021C92CFF|nr:hypothetical protein [Blastopirellula sp. J2-11]UUO06882.1 hypothetical protein M4951_00880 [Blastopirellula sp. J2-11]